MGYRIKCPGYREKDRELKYARIMEARPGGGGEQEEELEGEVKGRGDRGEEVVFNVRKGGGGEREGRLEMMRRRRRKENDGKRRRKVKRRRDKKEEVKYGGKGENFNVKKNENKKSGEGK